VAITVGNMLGGTEHTWDILPRIETNKSGLTYPEGHLQGYHLKPFGQLPATILGKVHQSSAFRILWEFFAGRGDRKAVPATFCPRNTPSGHWF